MNLVAYTMFKNHSLVSVNIIGKVMVADLIEWLDNVIQVPE